MLPTGTCEGFFVAQVIFKLLATAFTAELLVFLDASISELSDLYKWWHPITGERHKALQDDQGTSASATVCLRRSHGCRLDVTHLFGIDGSEPNIEEPCSVVTEKRIDREEKTKRKAESLDWKRVAPLWLLCQKKQNHWLRCIKI